MLPQDLKPVWTRRIQVAGGYRAVYCPDHPKAWPKGYVYEHRLLVETALNRFLDPDEVVHHADENKGNNQLSNLRVTTRSDHVRHHKLGTTFCILACDYCGDIFTRRLNQCASRKGYTSHFCSRSCNGKMQRRKQLQAPVV